jgi:hypothetical protein
MNSRRVRVPTASVPVKIIPSHIGGPYAVSDRIGDVQIVSMILVPIRNGLSISRLHMVDCPNTPMWVSVPIQCIASSAFLAMKLQFIYI